METIDKRADSGSAIDDLDRVCEFIDSRTSVKPRFGIVLGSGLGAFVSEVSEVLNIPYGEIPGFHASSVEGHAGRLVLGHIDQIPVAVMQGRIHLYEGHDIRQVVLPVRALVRMGCQRLIITNAAGGINSDYNPGDLVLIRDHINCMGAHPLIGKNNENLGPRFPDMTNIYSQDVRAALQSSLPKKMHEGVYAAMTGPSYETPAEIRMLKSIGADLVGMSTVPESVAAHHMGAQIIGISCVTNMAAGLGGALSHDEVAAVANTVQGTFSDLVRRTLGVWDGID